MALTIQGTNTSQTTTVTIPTHAIGDLIVITAFVSSSTTTATKPSAAGTVPAWTDIDNNTGANSCSMRTAYFVATATNHTSGTWTSATSIVAVVLRGQHTVVPIGGHSESGSTGTSMSAPSIVMGNPDGTSQLLHIFGGRSLTSWASPAAGYTVQATSAASGASAALVTKNTTTSDGSVSQGTQGSATGYRGATIEILAPTTSVVLYSATGTGAGPVNASGSWTHVAKSGDTVIADVYTDRPNVTSVTYGGTAMKMIGQIASNSASGYGPLARFVIYNVSAGSATVAVSAGSSWFAGNSVSYQNVQYVYIPEVLTSNGTTLTQSVTLTAGQMAVQSFGGPTVTWSTHTGGTNRHRLNGTFASIEINDSSVSDTFTSTISSAITWAALVSVLSPVTPTGVYYDNVSVGTGSTLSTSGSFTHTASAGAYVVVDIMWDRTATMTSITHNGNAMTLLGTATFTGAGGDATFFRYGIANVAAGSKTIAFNGGAVSAWTLATAMSIMGVGSVSPTTPTAGNSSNPVQGVACQPGQLILQGFAATQPMTAIVGGTSMYDTESANGTIAMSLSDNSTTFSAIGTGLYWGGLATVFGSVGAVFPPPPPYVIGTAISASTFVTIPAHQPGDLIVIGAFNQASTTAVTKPSAAGTVPAWVDIDNNAGANTCSMRTAYFVATANNHTSGTWTNSSSIGAIVYRGVGVIPIGGHAEAGGTGTGSTAPSITLSNSDGSSAILHIHSNRSSTSLNAVAPAGYTRRATDSTYTVFNTKDDTTSDGSIVQSGTTSSGYRGATIEIIGFNGPVFDAVGTGASGASTSLSWSHTASLGSYVFAAIELSNVASTVTVTACTYGGTAMKLLGSYRMNNDNTSAGGITYLYGLSSPPVQVKTVSVTVSASAKATANSVSYRGATIVGPPVTASGQGTSLSQTIGGSFGQRIVQVFGNAPPGGATSVTLTPSGGFNRYNGTANSGQSNISISDAIATTTFAATAAASSNWSGVAVVMSIYNGAFFDWF